MWTSAEPDCEPLPSFELVTTFQKDQRVYEVAFIEREDLSGPWPIDLVMRWRKNGEQTWRETANIAGVRLEKAVTLTGPRGEEIEALVVSSPGGSAQFISVIEIIRNPSGFKVLLDREMDKGSFDYRFGPHGELVGLQFHYSAWHVSPPGLTGHIYTARNIGWNVAKRSFTSGPIYVDDQMEREADLADILLATGSDYMLNTEVSYDEASKTYTFVYKPEGLLWKKTPPELRSAEKVRAVITVCKGSATITNLEAADNN